MPKRRMRDSSVLGATPSVSAAPSGPYTRPRLAASASSIGRRPSRAAGGDERLPIEEALAASRGRVYGPEGAAETLGVAPSTLESRIRRFKIDKHAFRRRVHGN